MRERLDSRSVLLWLGVVATGCQTHGARIASEELPPALRVDPPTVYFGLVEWGTTATQPITLSNDGHHVADVEALVASSDALIVDDAGPFSIPPRGAVQRTLEWTSDTFDGLDAQLDIVGPEIRAPSVTVTGGTSFAVLDVLSNEPADFGAVPLGCKGAAHLTLANQGLIDLVLSWEPGIAQPEFTLRDSSGNSLETPVSVAPRSSEILEVEFAPTSVHEIESTLEIGTNDPLAPIVEVDVRGEGAWNEPHTSEWIAGPVAQTILLHVNQRVIRDISGEAWPDRFQEFLPAFFDALVATHLPFRLAFAMRSDGQVQGALPYIDESFTAAEAVDAAWGMLIDLNDNDAGLETCLQALEVNAQWALDDTAPWLQSRLHLVSINPDAEQSPGDATYYIREFEEHKGSSNFAVHGIAGDLPSGCGGSPKSLTLYANPSPTLHDATVESGGVYLSICEEDWTKTAVTLVSACTQFTGFHFGERPMPESLQVFVDGTEIFGGWSYDAGTNALLFDDATFPPEGAHLRVDYYLAGSCE